VVDVDESLRWWHRRGLHHSNTRGGGGKFPRGADLARLALVFFLALLGTCDRGAKSGSKRFWPRSEKQVPRLRSG
jgi:hypothetical protein